MVLVTLLFDGYRVFFIIAQSICVVIDGTSSNLYPVNSEVPQVSVISSTLFLLFLNELLCLTSNPIYWFDDDSRLCQSFSFNARPSPNKVCVGRNCMNDTLNADLIEFNLSNIKPNVAYYRTSEQPILDKTFV